MLYERKAVDNYFLLGRLRHAHRHRHSTGGLGKIPVQHSGVKRKKIEKIDAAAIDFKEFAETYLTTSTPVILTNAFRTELNANGKKVASGFDLSWLKGEAGKYGAEMASTRTFLYWGK